MWCGGRMQNVCNPTGAGLCAEEAGRGVRSSGGAGDCQKICGRTREELCKVGTHPGSKGLDGGSSQCCVCRDVYGARWSLRVRHLRPSQTLHCGCVLSMPNRQCARHALQCTLRCQCRSGHIACG